MSRIKVAIFAIPFTLAFVLAACLLAGGPAKLPMLKSIGEPFRAVNFNELPMLQHFLSRDGTPLGYRYYAPAAGVGTMGSVVLVHGSSANSQSMHPLAQTFSAAGYAVYALDVRGHGGSGEKGRISYVGQLDDDVEDFIRGAQPPHPRTLAGFSLGGGFAIRIAGGAHRALFDNYLFLSPYVNHSTPTNRPNDAVRWASVGAPRLASLVLLNRFGVTRFNDLPVVNFAISEDPKANLTPWYSYALAISFQPENDYRATLRAIDAPMEVIVGQDDEVFFADKFRTLFDEAGRPDVPVTIVPATGHVALTLSDAGRRAAIRAVARLNAQKSEFPSTSDSGLR